MSSTTKAFTAAKLTIKATIAVLLAGICSSRALASGALIMSHPEYSTYGNISALATIDDAVPTGSALIVNITGNEVFILRDKTEEDEVDGIALIEPADDDTKVWETEVEASDTTSSFPGGLSTDSVSAHNASASGGDPSEVYVDASTDYSGGYANNSGGGGYISDTRMVSFSFDMYYDYADGGGADGNMLVAMNNIGIDVTRNGSIAMVYQSSGLNEVGVDSEEQGVNMRFKVVYYGGESPRLECYRKYTDGPYELLGSYDDSGIADISGSVSTQQTAFADNGFWEAPFAGWIYTIVGNIEIDQKTSEMTILSHPEFTSFSNITALATADDAIATGTCLVCNITGNAVYKLRDITEDDVPNGRTLIEPVDDDTRVWQLITGQRVDVDAASANTGSYSTGNVTAHNASASINGGNTTVNVNSWYDFNGGHAEITGGGPSVTSGQMVTFCFDLYYDYADGGGADGDMLITMNNIGIDIGRYGEIEFAYNGEDEIYGATEAQGVNFRFKIVYYGDASQRVEWYRKNLDEDGDYELLGAYDGEGIAEVNGSTTIQQTANAESGFWEEPFSGDMYTTIRNVKVIAED